MLFPIKPKEFFNKDTHAYADIIFSNEEINHILSLPEWLATYDACVGGTNNTDVVAKEIRETQISWLPVNDTTRWIWERISNLVTDINNQFFNFDLTGCYEGIQLGIYNEKNLSHYTWHIDASSKDKGVPRKLSMSLILSDKNEYEGGELQIKTTNDNPITLETPKGRAWFFPSYTLHRVTPVTKGVRRSLVLWVGGPAFK